MSFDEFLAIPPCTTGKHSAVDDTPVEATTAPATNTSSSEPAVKPVKPIAATTATAATSSPSAPAPTATAPQEPDSDDPSLEIAHNTTCRRRGCNSTYDSSKTRDRNAEVCVHHPGHPIFHEGSKGWSCCKRRVLEFDEFLRILGCTEKKGHLFIGKGKPEGEEKVESVR